MSFMVIRCWRFGWKAVGGLFVGAVLVGCATAPGQGEYTPTGDPVVDGLAMLERCPTRDRVLWQYRTALAALRQGQREQAEALMDEALHRLQGIYGPDSDARKSRGYFTRESKKTFLGEPYERAMAYYYRGVLYWMAGELDNARACFRSAQVMDSDTVDRSYSGDYVTCDVLDGWVTSRLGGDGSDAFARAQESARGADPPTYDPDHNVIIFAETGQGPVKYATGQYGEELRFRPGQSRAVRVHVRAGERTLSMEPLDDLTFQATTRGGRVMDHILANKAVFKGTTDAVGNAAIISGAIMASQRNRNSSVDEVGAGLIIAGVLSKLVSAGATPEADTRTWHNLPELLYVGSLALGPGEHRLVAEFLDAGGKPVTEATRDFVLTITETTREAVVFLSDQQ
jgi:tetratricopeptide (TPR) repeat protein